MSCLVNCSLNPVTLFVGAGAYRWVDKHNISHLFSVYPSRLSELGDDSGFCNAVVLYISSQGDSYLPIIGESLTNFSSPLKG